ncbi:EF-hand domain-containing protein [Psychroflexus aestuariivivens]|uniref:hypothetical protein n=1 Tax=Psychroflexus aestuariivivens TaxID=1795040 RepID=UPI000FD6CFEE|nr:hypothetical protein [Psychroflexus aestuariivivens]
MNLFKLTLSSFFILCSSLIFAQQDFDEWDEDDDYLIEKEEFTDNFIKEYYPVWAEGAEPDGIIEEGFFKESFAGLDTDNDGFLSDEEWLIGYNYFYDDYLVNEKIGFIDTDEDGLIDYDEYYEVIYDTQYFTDVDLDSDNYISEYELAEYVFNNWDVDDNGVLSKYEWNSFKAYYLDV